MPKPPALPRRDEILGLLASQTRALHAREIASRLSVREGAYLELLGLLGELVLDGAIRALPGQRFRATGEQSLESRDGVFSMHPRGFGFVSSPAVSQDVFVPAGAQGGAMHGDRVRVTVLAKTRRGLEGRIEQVLERANVRVAGLLRRRGRSAWLEPDDVRVRGPIVLTGALEFPDGQAVVAVVTRFPEQVDENPEGALLECLGEPGHPVVELRKILLRERIDEGFAADAVDQAAGFGAAIDALHCQGREDLRAIPLVTIDPDDARDHDDAIWVGASDAGYEVWVAIADVAAYVTEGTPLDQEARARAFSIYLPDRAVPMLPSALSANLCSLVADQDRLCLAVHLQLDASGRTRSARLTEAVMRSRARLTYSGVARDMRWSEGLPGPGLDPQVRSSIEGADRLARALRKRRIRRGSLELQIPEAEVVLDPKSAMPLDVRRRASDPGVRRAYHLIEELMILANEAVAHWLIARGRPAVFRIHPPPDQTRLERLSLLCELLGIEFDPDDVASPKRFAAFLATVSEHPAADVISMLTLRSLKQASYALENLGHFGLALQAYLHFTSPIRRYPDLLVHREVKGALQAEQQTTALRSLPSSPPLSGENHTAGLREAVEHCNARERKVAEIEREVVDLYRALLMRTQLGSIHEGKVVEVLSAGVIVTLDDPFVDVRVTEELLGPSSYELSEDGLRVVAARSGDTISLGDRMLVRVESVRLERRSVLGRRLAAPGSPRGARTSRAVGGTRHGSQRNRAKIRKKPR